MRTCLLALVLLGSAALSPAQGGPSNKNLGFEVPPGFEVTLYADDALATDIFSLTCDAQGRVVVAGKGYIKVLHDTDGDGKADKVTLFADMPKSGAHGMYFEGPDLICNGDQGVRRLADTDGDGKADKISPPFFRTEKDTEHAANGIVRGPDGWYYLITGNDAGITSDHNTQPGAPVRNPNSGVLLRFSPDGKKSQVLADGFRNPYALDFNHLGDVFTVDADGERVHHLPYYAPTRLFDIALGMHHGWLLPGWVRAWSRPAWWPDNVERLVEIGRGSPTGLLVYRHRAFPQRYRNGVFHVCWTFGRIYFFPLTPRGSTYESKMEVFLRTTGDVGFAPTGMAVAPDGSLLVAIGGRGTRGSVFRVRWRGPGGPTPSVRQQDDPLRSVLAADQPLASWSRAKWVPAARHLGAEPFRAAVTEGKLPLEERIRAVEILTELFGGVPVELARQVYEGEFEAELKARVIWSLSRTTTALAARRLTEEATSSPEPRIARAAWEGLLQLPAALNPDWKAGLHSPDRRVRAAALAVARGPGRASFVTKYHNPLRTPREKLAWVWVQEPPGRGENPVEPGRTCLEVFLAEKDPMLRLEAVRLLQIFLGDVVVTPGPEEAFIGYVPRSRDNVDPQWRREAAGKLAQEFPTGQRTLDLELARLLGMLGEEVPGLLERLSRKWQPGSSAEDDTHYLLVLARLPGKRSTEVTRRTAAALTGIYVKLAARGAAPSDAVPQVLEALFDRLLQHDAALASALVADSAFGMPGHALYANRLPLEAKQTATRKLLLQIRKLDKEEQQLAWMPELVRLVSALPERESLPLLRDHFTDPRLTDSIALVLARARQPEDVGRLVQALNSTQPSVIQAATEALVKLTDRATPAEIGLAVRTLRRLENQKVDKVARQKVLELLQRWTGRVKTDASASDWVEWYTKTYPKEAAALPGLASPSFANWKQRLDRLDWSQGDAGRGWVIFQKKNCFRCHGDARRLGPDLTGVAQRFSRDDLFTAIIDPNKDVAPAYRAMTIITTSGKTYTGVSIYQSPDLHLLQTTPDTTVRIPREELYLVQPSHISFMPAGLLDDLTDREIVDLYAYLQGLRKK